MAPRVAARPRLWGRYPSRPRASPKSRRSSSAGLPCCTPSGFAEGLKTFTAVAEQDPGCAMALVGHRDQPAPEPLQRRGRGELREGGSGGDRERRRRSARRRSASAITSKPRRCSTPTSARNGGGERAIAYEEAMARVVESYPADVEAKVFYALALNFAADLNDQTYAKPLKAARLLEPLLPAYPEHPGVAHFLIHSYDFPPLAEKGLAAARRYASIAPSAAARAAHAVAHLHARGRMGGLRCDATGAPRTPRARSRAATKRCTRSTIRSTPTSRWRVTPTRRRPSSAARITRRAFRFYRPAGPVRPGGGARPLRARARRLEVGRAAAGEADEDSLRERDHALRARDRCSRVPATRTRPARKSRGWRNCAKRSLPPENTYWADQVEIQWLGAAAWAALAGGAARRGAQAHARSRGQGERDREGVHLTRSDSARARAAGRHAARGRPARARRSRSTKRRSSASRIGSGAGMARRAPPRKPGNAAKAKTYYGKLAALAQRGDERPELRQARQFLAARQP